MRRLPSRRWRRQRGGITLLLIMVLIVLSAMLGALAVRGSTNELRLAGSHRSNRSAFYCAEAGLNAARPIFGTNIGQWNTIFAGGSPTFAAGVTYPITGDLDGDTKADYSVTIADNYDEFPTSNPAVDNDLAVIMTSTCISTTIVQSPNGQRTLRSIVAYSGNGGTDYRDQAGHSSTHSGNAN
jgi:type II secretory pathway pseudopilin PulG